MARCNGNGYPECESCINGEFDPFECDDCEDGSNWEGEDEEFALANNELKVIRLKEIA